jgi:peptidyl-prolyl cis-trans isomerase C
MVPALMNSILRRLAGFAALAVLLPLTVSAQESKPAAAVELPDPVAVVEGEKISRADLEETFNGALASSGINADDLTADQKMAGYREILDELIVDKLISRKASSVEIKDADLETEIGRVKSQFPSEDVFKAEMTKAGETESSFRDSVKKMMQQQKWMEDQIGDKASVSDDDIKKFYDENKKEFEHPELVRASHILIRVPEDADDKTVAEKKKAADAALERVTSKKEDFTAVAKEVSEEPGAKESGGDLNFFPKDRMVPEFANAAFAMKKGDISKEPVRTKFGWHIINVTDRKDSGTMPYDEVKGQVGSYLEGGKRREAVRNVIDALRAEAKIDSKLPAAPAAPAPAGS